ncbi:MAG: FCD domain-containing protein [Paracoccus sp. (in: a-proteobacteria)]|nr:FCD domain-containing protein [Paracoccus sp. (in: a-proteobacteria)]
MVSEIESIPGAEHPCASDPIYEALIADIRAGRLAPGAALPSERALGERFDASRPTVREALSRMQMRGFLSTGAGRRPRVVQPDMASVLASAGERLRDILDDAEIGAHLEQMRLFIETGAAREAARRSDNTQIALLQQALRRNGQAIGSDDFARTDIGFHRALVAVIGNPVILTLHDLFVSRFLATRPRSGDPTAQDRQAHDEHRAIFDAITAGDQLASAEVMERHLDRSFRDRLLAGPAPE